MFTCEVRKLEVVPHVGRAFGPLLPLQSSPGVGNWLVCTEECRRTTRKNREGPQVQMEKEHEAGMEKEHEAGTDGEAQSEVSGCGLQKHIRCLSFFS